MVVQLERFVHEPDLEEAAIRYANGDHEGAESGLLQVLGSTGRMTLSSSWNCG